MIDVKLTVNGKTFKKSKPMLKDYLNILKYNKENDGKTFLTDEQPVRDAISIIVDWYNGEVSQEEIEKEIDLAVIINTYRAIESNVTEVFTNVPLEKALEIITKRNQ